MAAKYSLNIYGENDEIVKTYETNNVLWGFYLEAVKAYDEMQDMDEAEQFEMIGIFIKRLFVGLTDDELTRAAGDDVINVFMQLMRKSQSIAGGKKNAVAARK